jgi:hypothetical protein
MGLDTCNNQYTPDGSRAAKDLVYTANLNLYTLTRYRGQ